MSAAGDVVIFGDSGSSLPFHEPSFFDGMALFAPQVTPQLTAISHSKLHK